MIFIQFCGEWNEEVEFRTLFLGRLFWENFLKSAFCWLKCGRSWCVDLWHLNRNDIWKCGANNWIKRVGSATLSAFNRFWAVIKVQGFVWIALKRKVEEESTPIPLPKKFSWIWCFFSLFKVWKYYSKTTIQTSFPKECRKSDWKTLSCSNFHPSIIPTYNWIIGNRKIH